MANITREIVTLAEMLSSRGGVTHNYMHECWAIIVIVIGLI